MAQHYSIRDFFRQMQNETKRTDWPEKHNRNGDRFQRENPKA